MELSFPWNVCSLEYSLPWSEQSKNFRSIELSFPGIFAPIGLLTKIGGEHYSNLSVGVFWQW